MGNEHSKSRQLLAKLLHKPLRKRRSPQADKQGIDSNQIEPQWSAAQLKELRRRVRDARNSIRYMLVSEFDRRLIFYYNVSRDGYVMNDPQEGTLFKRREAAEALRRLLSSHVLIVKFTTKSGKLRRVSRFRGFVKAKQE